MPSISHDKSAIKETGNSPTNLIVMSNDTPAKARLDKIWRDVVSDSEVLNYGKCVVAFHSVYSILHIPYYILGRFVTGNVQNRNPLPLRAQC
jgi:hypothetical protein